MKLNSFIFFNKVRSKKSIIFIDYKLQDFLFCLFGFIFDVFSLLNYLLYLWIFVVEIFTFLFIVLSFQTQIKVVSTITMTRTRSKMTHTHTASSIRNKITSAQRCKAYRAALAKDPALYQLMKDNDKARARRNRQKTQLFTS